MRHLLMEGQSRQWRCWHRGSTRSLAAVSARRGSTCWTAACRLRPRPGFCRGHPRLRHRPRQRARRDPVPANPRKCEVMMRSTAALSFFALGRPRHLLKAPPLKAEPAHQTSTKERLIRRRAISSRGNRFVATGRLRQRPCGQSGGPAETGCLRAIRRPSRAAPPQPRRR